MHGGERAKRASLLEDENTRDEVREMATDIMATPTTKLTSLRSAQILSDLDKWLSLRSDKGKKDLSGSGEDGARRGGEGGGVAISRRIKQMVEYAKTNHLHSNLNGW